MEEQPILGSAYQWRLISYTLKQLSRKQSKEVNAEILQILLNNPEFTRLHLSIYYPFTLDDLDKYRNKLIWGSIKYTTFVWDIKQEPIKFAEIGLSFNVNLFMLCKQEEFIVARQIGIEQEDYSSMKHDLPLHLKGELEGRYSTTIMAPELQRPFLENFDANRKAEDILVAYELLNSQNDTYNVEALNTIIKKHGLVAAYSKYLWDELLVNYINEEMITAIMKVL